MTISEAFYGYQDTLFQHLFGSDIDENGQKYSDVYKWELEGLCQSFVEMCEVYTNHNFKINPASIMCWILCEFAGCFNYVKREGCFVCAYELYRLVKTNENCEDNNIRGEVDLYAINF